MYERGTTGKGKNFRTCDYAVSEVVGTILLLGIVATATSIFLLAGTNTIDSAKSSATLNGVEEAFTMADSRLSKARFSTAVFQEAPLKVSKGVVVVNGTWDDSHIIVYNIGNSEIYNSSLGTIKCITDEGEVAYQDGGVWMRDNTGGSIMISPPDFDYNGVTLTLPVMRIDGNESLSTSGTNSILINANSTSAPKTIFPSTEKGGNPIPMGYLINITIKSDYYAAWASYINERTLADAVIDAKNKTVNISLKTGIPMQSGLVDDGFMTKSMDTTYDAPLFTFNLDLNTRNSGNDYTITYGVVPAGTADPDFQISVTRTKGNGNKEWAMITTYYKHGTDTEKFQSEIEFERKNEEEIYLDLLNRSIMLDYRPTSTLAITKTWGDILTTPDPCTSFKPEYYDPTYSEASTSPISGYVTNKSLYDILQHYMRLMAFYDQANGDAYGGPKYGVIDKNKYDETKSTFQISYASGQEIKYLYITEGTLKTNLTSRG